MALTRLRGYRKVGVLVVVVGSASAIWIIGVQWPKGGGRGSRSSNAGGLVCEEATWDFGLADAVDTPTLSHDFILANDSQDVVRIREVRSSCGCVVADGYEKTLPPRGSTRLTARVTLAPVPGPFRKELLVGVEGSSTGWLPLRVVGAIDANASLYTIPSQINFGELAPGEAKERVIQVRRYDNTPVKLLEVIGSEKALQSSFDAAPPPPGGNATVRVRLTAEDLPPGAYAAIITIRTGHEEFPKLIVRVSALVARPDWGLVKSIIIANLSPGESRDVLLRQSNGEGPAANVVSASYQGNTALSIELLGGESASDRPRLRITRPAASAEAAVVRGTIGLRLQNVEEEIKVPITVLCSGR